ncbi:MULTISPECIES: hypothetical protein [unclassified Burkholderia]|uniref:hypothetical protein n=1 Tax=unclassified Burkholderia TaxID=2613784 RepID=UPI000754125A|nr:MULTISPECIES: hypothetical protein [unclassified Burkholderia]KVN06300.1 hypothetical protein WT08_20345 [Burkholderia sp. MSMB1552]KWZ46872.1 hypothetical protein WS92_30355 [Burkholderia sp. MSMB1588]
MNTLVAGAVGASLGIAGLVLYVMHNAHVQDATSVQVAKMDCHNARFDEDFARMRGDSQPALQRAASEADAACGEYRGKKAAAEVRQVERNQSSDQLVRDLNDALKK